MQELEKEIKDLKGIIASYETLHQLSQKELKEAKAAISGFESMLNLSAQERKQSYETLDAFRLVQEVSRNELIEADKIIQNILSFDKELSEISDVKPLMSKILKSSLQSLSGEVGIIFLKREGKLIPIFSENMSENQITILDYITSLVEKCMKSQSGKLISDYQIKQGNEEKNVSYICNSFKQDERKVGAIYLEKPSNDIAFHNNDLTTIEVFSLQIAIAIQQSNTNIKVISMLREIHQKNEMLEKAQKVNERLSLTKDAFLKNLSFELKTPLSFISGYSKLLQGTEPENFAQIQSNVESIFIESNKLKLLLDDLLLITNLESEIIIKKVDLDLNNIIEETLSKLEEIIKRKKIEVSLTVAGKVKVDKVLFAKALFNIIKNAIMYNKRNGKIEIITEHRNKDTRITIRDTGIGIAESNLNFVFDKFFRADNVDSYEGIGLGLFIAKQVLELHGGFISIESELIKGTTVQINLNHSK